MDEPALSARDGCASEDALRVNAGCQQGQLGMRRARGGRREDGPTAGRGAGAPESLPVGSRDESQRHAVIEESK